MRNRASLFLVLVPAFSFSTLAHGQSLVGTRVRLTPTTGAARVTGFVLAEDETSLTLDVGNHARSFARAGIGELELSRRPSRRGRGAAIGALAGAAIGGIGVWAANRCGSEPEFLCDDGPSWGLAGALVFAPVGALVGLAVSPGEEWQSVEEKRLRVSVGPVRGRGIAASLRFSF
jgi:hypothetical protein